jgi:hypothetical protein
MEYFAGIVRKEYFLFSIGLFYSFFLPPPPRRSIIVIYRKLSVTASQCLTELKNVPFSLKNIIFYTETSCEIKIRQFFKLIGRNALAEGSLGTVNLLDRWT